MSGSGFGPLVHKKVVDVTTNSGFEYRLDVDNNISYEAFADAGASESDPVWRISRTIRQLDGSYTTSFAADGKGGFNQIWDDRLSLFPAATEIDFFQRDFENLIPLLVNANWMQLANFDKITPSFSADTATLSYSQSGAIVGQAAIRYENRLDWDITLNRYINAEDGDWLLAEDDTPLNLA